MRIPAEMPSGTAGYAPIFSVPEILRSIFSNFTQVESAKVAWVSHIFHEVAFTSLKMASLRIPHHLKTVDLEDPDTKNKTALKDVKALRSFLDRLRNAVASAFCPPLPMIQINSEQFQQRTPIERTHMVKFFATELRGVPFRSLVLRSTYCTETALEIWVRDLLLHNPHILELNLSQNPIRGTGAGSLALFRAMVEAAHHYHPLPDNMPPVELSPDAAHIEDFRRGAMAPDDPSHKYHQWNPEAGGPAYFMGGRERPVDVPWKSATPQGMADLVSMADGRRVIPAGLGGVACGCEGVEGVYDTVPCGLRSLIISGCPLQHDGLRFLAVTLAHDPLLERLSWSAAPNLSIGQGGLETLLRAFHTRPGDVLATAPVATATATATATDAARTVASDPATATATATAAAAAASGDLDDVAFLGTGPSRSRLEYLSLGLVDNGYGYYNGFGGGMGGYYGGFSGRPRLSKAFQEMLTRNDTVTHLDVDLPLEVWFAHEHYDNCLDSSGGRTLCFNFRGTEEGLAIPRTLDKLTALSLHHASLSHSFIRDLAYNAFPNLHSLFLAAPTPVTLDVQISRALVSSRTVHVLDISATRAYDNTAYYGFFQPRQPAVLGPSFFETLSFNRSVTLLKCPSCGLASSEPAWEALVAYISTSPVLIGLDLQRNQMTPREVDSLTEALRANTTLRYLDLSHNKVNDAGAMQFARLLEQHQATGLRQLGLVGNEIGIEGATALTEAARPPPAWRRTAKYKALLKKATSIRAHTVHVFMFYEMEIQGRALEIAVSFERQLARWAQAALRSSNPLVCFVISFTGLRCGGDLRCGQTLNLCYEDPPSA
ncbi:hypothetical protein PAPYR_2136 [Paratrimastix pyriformis]|uniref:Uncharacterized protein n=1 Tax=Paratrimastix pyriformis TaxID=342808 RepID=A0ABQ8UQW6_9EUKA|nr:hypothetical protein PAPYR_2136 [Paratrimastix pyriformis]